MLEALPDLPHRGGALQLLDCRNNLLTRLPSLRLYCQNNTLKALQALPHTLSILDCSDNLLTRLPALPSTLTTLNCQGNKKLVSAMCKFFFNDELNFYIYVQCEYKS